jgi:GNAT superfamily N-acetyltransferase
VTRLVRVSELSESPYVVRPATKDDSDVIALMTLVAFNWDPERTPFTMAQLLADPALAKYVEDWPRPGEQGMVAETPGAAGEGAVPIGAAWWRYFSAADPGYGYVADDVPEIGIAVVAAWRGRGVGRDLLRGIADAARAAGLSRLSLSVERANPAARLYAAEGYETVGSDETAETRLKRL